MSGNDETNGPDRPAGSPGHPDPTTPTPGGGPTGRGDAAVPTSPTSPTDPTGPTMPIGSGPAGTTTPIGAPGTAEPGQTGAEAGTGGGSRTATGTAEDFATPPHQPSGPPGGRGPSTNRLQRSRGNRMMAGVAGGIGESLGIDPVLPRVAFAVLTVFGGLGIALYMVCWLLMPDEREEVSLFEALLGRGPRQRGMLVADAVLAVTSATLLIIFLSRRHGTDYALLGVVLAIGIVVYRHLQTAGPAAPSGIGPGAGPGPGPGAGAGPGTGPGPGHGAGPGAAAAPPRTEHGASAPPAFATWSAPRRAATTRRERRRREPRSPLGMVVFCLALILAGVLAALHRGGLHLSGRPVLAGLLALIGVGLLVGAWWGRARGLIALGIPVALVLTVAGDPLLDDWGARDQLWAPTDAGAVSTAYQLSAGQGVLDLRDVDFAGTDTRTEVRMGAGNLRVEVPPDVDVRVHGHVSLGTMTLLGVSGRGLHQDRTITDDGVDGPGGGRLRILADLEFGQVEVVR